jgi:hypothetical protein
MNDAPSSYRMEQAMSVLLAVRQRLLQDDPDLADDERLFADMLEGESGDAMEVLDRVLRAAVYAKTMAKAAKERAAEIGERAARYERREASLRGAAFAVLDALGLPKRELPDLTASIRAGQPAVVITDETALPEVFVRVKREPDKTLIGAALRAGREVPGAVMNNSMPTLTVRVK